MAKAKIVLVAYDEEDNSLQMLDYEGTWESVANNNPSPTLEEIADFCDAKAESRNNHAFVPCHRILAALLHKRLGRKLATSIMFEIAEYGGLDGMNDVGTAGTWREGGAFKDFGMPDNWSEWSLQD